MRDMASDAAQRAAGKIKPSEEEMSGIDEPAEENVWHDKPDLSTANIKSQVNSQVGKRKEKVCSHFSALVSIPSLMYL